MAVRGVVRLLLTMKEVTRLHLMKGFFCGRHMLCGGTGCSIAKQLIT